MRRNELPASCIDQGVVLAKCFAAHVYFWSEDKKWPSTFVHSFQTITRHRLPIPSIPDCDDQNTSNFLRYLFGAWALDTISVHTAKFTVADQHAIAFTA